LLRPEYVERVVDQRLHDLEEAHGVRQFGVALEGLFILPVRIEEEELWVAKRSEMPDADATRLFLRGKHALEHRLRHGFLVPGTRVESREDVQFHSPPSEVRPRLVELEL